MHTPVEEVASTLTDLVRSGKVRYVGLSDVPAWYAARLPNPGGKERLGTPRGAPARIPAHKRSIEREHVPAARELGIGVTPWSPLASGFLSGKYKRSIDGASGGGRIEQFKGVKNLCSSGSRICRRRLADARSRPEQSLERSSRTPAEVALAWVIGQPGVTSTLIGATRPEQLTNNLSALDITLSREMRTQLDAVSALENVPSVHVLRRHLPRHAPRRLERAELVRDVTERFRAPAPRPARIGLAIGSRVEVARNAGRLSQGKPKYLELPFGPLRRGGRHEACLGRAHAWGDVEVEAGASAGGGVRQEGAEARRGHDAGAVRFCFMRFGRDGWGCSGRSVGCRSLRFRGKRRGFTPRRYRRWCRGSWSLGGSKGRLPSPTGGSASCALRGWAAAPRRGDEIRYRGRAHRTWFETFFAKKTGRKDDVVDAIGEYWELTGAMARELDDISILEYDFGYQPIDDYFDPDDPEEAWDYGVSKERLAEMARRRSEETVAASEGAL